MTLRTGQRYRIEGETFKITRFWEHDNRTIVDLDVFKRGGRKVIRKQQIPADVFAMYLANESW